MELRSLVLALFAIAQAEAFSPGMAPLRAQRAAVSTNIRMAGWQDKYSGNAFKNSGEDRKLEVAKSSFDAEQCEQCDVSWRLAWLAVG